ncbi:Glycosyltransferase, GT2 family [Nonlabens sp. Hel1_33_55]|uniref:glycosyltransferase family 2 protein n=1 Tax=Nonlabens sp. Hel1_33_55 TaxID=1336802 RepID=UPI000875CFB0|nr:glycosyltransferase [Nonlabens sp. Hel1_33_55]SCX92753.1 Glycosyltransferase, GT2 family [Nonlabens sp. Hel1_33_55]
MKISLIICTYQRPIAISRLLESVRQQTVYPDQILVIDGSIDDETLVRFRESEIPNLHYYKVPEKDRGLTRQRNYGIERVDQEMDIVAFLDDDTILLENYFEEIIETYQKYPEAMGVGGYIINEVNWVKATEPQRDDLNHFYFDNYRRKESSRYKLRRRLNLIQKEPPGYYPDFGHGRSIGFLPPSGKIYQTETLMGGVSSFPYNVLQTHKFSEYFEGYGLYEDADFSLRLAKIGKLYVNAAAQLEHHHDASGRPNLYKYGKMVVRNGWYVWRVKNPKPLVKDQTKWYQITILLAAIRFLNIFTTKEKWQAFEETSGRVVGLFSLLWNKPRP